MRSLHGWVAFFAFEPVPLFSNYSPTKRGNSVAFIPQTIGASQMYNLSGLSEELAEAYRAKPWHDKKPEKLLGVSNDAKTIKGEKIGVSTAILYLSPHNISGVNVCPMAEIAQCATGCLNTAGRGAMTTVQLSRLRKTLYFNQYRNEFLDQLKEEIFNHVCKSIHKDMVPAIRLNGTSDIRWELLIWDFMVEMHDKYGARFYDYTKIPNRIIPDRDVYDITFSYSGVAEYARHYQTARAMGHRIAVVFRSKDIIPRHGTVWTWCRAMIATRGLWMTMEWLSRYTPKARHGTTPPALWLTRDNRGGMVGVAPTTTE